MTIRPLPKWAMQKYATLWSRFKTRKFTYEQASKLLNENKNRTSVLFSHLKKSGWLKVSLSEEDSRKRIYTLISPEKAMEGIAK